MLFRWFVGVSMDAPVWDVTVDLHLDSNRRQSDPATEASWCHAMSLARPMTGKWRLPYSSGEHRLANLTVDF
ncbi:hypothetical protein LWC05_08265 [Acetobacter sicerae]|uniref:Transposase InsH N-terminal domain-containing protein n=1 Tax=Acetobacter sicerae TaxID=85325 RepID=A0ABS8VVK4_9PROT|nr:MULTISPECIES: hypothetical protein [Acetobacter]MBC9008954.1 hypothetical protein [Acetobacter tropicalis]MCE0743881.1 hypothetical protein [Acetobacter sicerae]